MAGRLHSHLLENHLLRPDSHEEFVVSYGLPRPRIAVDYKRWSSLSHPDQENPLNYVSRIDFLHDLPPTELKLVHKIEPGNSRFDYDLLSAIQRGVDEADMNRHVRLQQPPKETPARKRGDTTGQDSGQRDISAPLPVDRT
jgi:hypothetical protein